MQRFLTGLLIATPLAVHAEQGVRVVTDLPIISTLVAEVQGDIGQVAPIMTAGTSPHDWSLKPSDAAKLSQAELVIWVGDGLSPQFAKTLDAVAADAALMALMDVPGTTHREFPDDDDHEGHSHSASDHGHDHGDDDPHGWLSPDNVMVWTSAIYDILAARDPDGLDGYAMRAKASIAATQAAMSDVAERLAQTDPKYVEAHDALGYFADTFGLRPVAALADGHAADPGPRQLAAVEEDIRSQGAKCMLIEVGDAPRLALSVAERNDLTVVEIDLTGGTGQHTTYAEWLSDLATALEAC